MEIAIICLLTISIVLFIISFFAKDKLKEIEKQVDSLSLTLMQESYQIKKKMKVLEEELLLDQEMEQQSIHSFKSSPKQDFFTQPAPEILTTKERVLSLYKLGYSYERISKEMKIPIEEIKLIIESIEMRGHFHE
ncbi:hypothetical protein LCL95_11990 [Bacillus timonensis]|nr:hypothetical protein [Bacillus timonensis]